MENEVRVKVNGWGRRWSGVSLELTCGVEVKWSCNVVVMLERKEERSALPSF